MGGAGFPTGTKWDMVRGQAAEPPKYVICNADEAEPGHVQGPPDPGRAAAPGDRGDAPGACARSARRQGWVFIRHEYAPEEEVLREELARPRAAGVPTASTSTIFTSPGGYILGEETALIECMEGHRGEPRNKPPFPGGYGLHGQPTLMNNVETFAAVPVILERGADWWKAQGVNGGAGLKFFSVSGPRGAAGRVLRAGRDDGRRGDRAGRRRARRRGARRGAAGRRVDELPRARLPRRCRSPSTRSREAGSALGTGAMVVMAEGTDLLAAATGRAELLPQRVVRQVRAVPGRLAQGAADPRPRCSSAAAAPRTSTGGSTSSRRRMRLTSICGLGQVALGPVMSVLRHAARAAPDARVPRRS